MPEVLPPHLIEFAEPDVDGSSRFPFLLPLSRQLTHSISLVDLVRAISRGIVHVRAGRHDPLLAHEELKEVYSWRDVAVRTEDVYYQALEVPRVPVVERLRRFVRLSSPCFLETILTLLDSRRYYGTGAVFGKIMCIIAIVDYILLAVLEYFSPAAEMDRAPKFNLKRWKKVSSLLPPFHFRLTDSCSLADLSGRVEQGVT